MTGSVSTSRVAREGHPSLPEAALAIGALCLLLLASGTFAAAGDGHRLAGTLAVGREHLAFVELPGGDQVLVRAGSDLGNGGHVLHVDADRVTIAFRDGVRDLWLEGSGRPVMMDATPSTKLPASDDGHVHVRRVDAAHLRGSLATARPATPPTAVERGMRPDPGKELAQRIAPVIALPANARIVAVNERPVRTADGAIALINAELARNTAVRLNLASPAGAPPGRVYLLPARP